MDRSPAGRMEHPGSRPHRRAGHGGAAPTASCSVTAARRRARLPAVAANLPTAGPLNSDPARSARTAWWEMGDEDLYLWEHLIEHLVEAGRGDADTVAGDLRW